MKATQDDNVGTSKAQETVVRSLPVAASSPDLEIKDAQLIFGAIWRELEGNSAAIGCVFPGN